MTAGRPARLVVRPRRITIYAAIATAVVVAVTVAVGVLLRGSDTGITFRGYDQYAVIAVGLIFGAILMVSAARPRLIADADGLDVRNMIGHRRIDWQLVHRIVFRPGAQWPEVVLADDESYPVMAIQAMDRQRAVDNLVKLRALLDAYAPDRPQRSAQAQASWEASLLAQQNRRPLGKLELEDLRRQAQPARRRSWRRGRGGSEAPSGAGGGAAVREQVD